MTSVSVSYLPATILATMVVSIAVLGGLAAVLLTMRLAYRSKRFARRPLQKPSLCWLPKYRVALPSYGAEVSIDDLTAKLAEFGFVVKRQHENAIVFNRGHALGDFSINLVKLIVTANLPLADPVELEIQYGHWVGVIADTGDLWQFCEELAQQVEQRSQHAANVEGPETGNPYQPPLS